MEFRTAKATAISGAVVAHAFDLHLNLLALQGPRRRLGRLPLQFGQALGTAAFRAGKVRMTAGIVLRARLKPPHVVADVDPPREPDPHQIAEVAVQRCRIPAVLPQAIDQIGVRQGRLSGIQDLQHRQPRRGRAQTSGAQAIAIGDGGTCSRGA